MKPAVSCICVTQNRRFFLRRAIAYFWRASFYFEAATGQTAELVIVDGSPHSNEYLVEDACSLTGERIAKYLPGKIRYVSEPSPAHARTGYFHNRAVELSQGDVIVQWDDDDWHDGYRIFKQWFTLKEAHVPSFTFTSRFYLYHLTDKLASLARTWHAGKGSGTVGAMFAYHRATWEKVPFRDVPQGEDNFFWDDCKAARIPFLDSEDPSFCAYVRHHQNGSPLTHLQPDHQVTALVRNMLEQAGDLCFYDEVTELLPLENWNRLRTPMNPYMRRQFELRRR